MALTTSSILKCIPQEAATIMVKTGIEEDRTALA